MDLSVTSVKKLTKAFLKKENVLKAKIVTQYVKYF